MLPVLRAAALSMAVSLGAWGAEPIEILPPAKGTLVQHGKASFYAEKFHGRRTASGELLDQNALTAASRTLPLGTLATVTNMQTGESVRVRINDRGPYTKGKIIDLSRSAANALGISARQGVGNVRVEASPIEQPTEDLMKEISARVARRTGR